MKKLIVIAICVFTFSQIVKSQNSSIKKETNKIFLDINNTRENLAADELMLVWLNPVDQTSVVRAVNMTLKLGIYSKSPITNVTVLINNQPGLQARGLTQVTETGYEKFDKYIETPLTLSDGDNTIMILATNEAGGSVTGGRNISLLSASKEILARTDYALFFATDEYEEWDDLTNPVNDAKTIAEELEKNYGFKVDMVTNATTDEMMMKIREYGKKSYLPYDQLMIFFAGHGQFDEIYKAGYIVGKNSKKNDPAMSTYLAHSVLRNAIENIPTEHTLLVMDACFGGTFDPKIAQAGSRGADAMYDEVSPAEYIKRKLKFKTRQFITSGGKEYVPDGRPGMHSPFARKFIEALRSYGGRDKILTISEIASFVEKINPEPRLGEFGTNTPGSDFLFVVQN